MIFLFVFRWTVQKVMGTTYFSSASCLHAFAKKTLVFGHARFPQASRRGTSSTTNSKNKQCTGKYNGYLSARLVVIPAFRHGPSRNGGPTVETAWSRGRTIDPKPFKPLGLQAVDELVITKYKCNYSTVRCRNRRHLHGRLQWSKASGRTKHPLTRETESSADDLLVRALSNSSSRRQLQRYYS